MADFYTLTISRTRSEANQTLWVEFDVPAELAEQFAFQPGQYLTFAVDVDGLEVRRSYSICSIPGERLAVAIKLIDGGAFSAYAHQHFAPGMQIKVQPPAGEFRVDCDQLAGDKVLCIAAGSGITPVISIVRAVLQADPRARVTLIYGNRRAADIIFREQLLWLKNRYLERFQWINIFSREQQRAAVLNGRIDNRKGAELNRCLIDIQSYDAFYLCGPEGMISEVTRGLRGVGIEPGQIHYELFFASAEDAALARARHQARALEYADLSTQVRVRSGGREVSFELTADGENILDGALSAGLDLPFSCKGGVCATCKARVVEGEVDMDLNHALSPAELAAGFVLTCQSHPITDEVMVDFDVI